MLATKCINGKIIELTKNKQELLNNEYSEFNNLCKFLSEANKYGIDEYCEYSFVKDKFKIYSLTKTQAIRNCTNSKNEQPLIITIQSIRIKTNTNKLTPLWIRIPIYNKRKGIWLPVKMGIRELQLIKTSKVRGIKILRRENIYYVRITIQKEINEITSYSNILAIDLGEKNIASVCGTSDKNPLFLGRNARGLRRHYSWLRKQLGTKKLLKKIKKIKQKEKNTINTLLHGISKRITDIAYKTNSFIVLGDLKGIRNSAKNKGKRMNRMISSMPYYKLTQMVEYKAKWLGIKVFKIKEKNTSRMCSKCGYMDKSNRKTQGHFKCINCGYEINADYNACLNIIKRSLGYIFNDGAIAYTRNSRLT